MFRAEGKGCAATDEDAGVRIDFHWRGGSCLDGYVLYQIIGGAGFALMTELGRRRGFFLQRIYYRSVYLRYVRHVKDDSIVDKPVAPVSDEFRERIANDLLAAARCLKIRCELTYE